MAQPTERTPMLGELPLSERASQRSSRRSSMSSRSADSMRNRMAMVMEKAVFADLHKQEAFYMETKLTVYSAIVYAPGISRITTGSNWSYTVMLVIALIVFNALLQLGLLYAVLSYGFRDSVAEQVISYGSGYDHHILSTYTTFLGYQQKQAAREHPIFPAGWVEEGTPDPPCRRGVDGVYHCMPPSVEFTSQWDSLDKDGDGVWAISEIALTPQEAEKLSGASLTDHEVEAKRRLVFFNKIIGSLKERSEWLKSIRSINGSLYLSQDILSAKAIPKAYFQYWAGDAMFCTKFASQQCEHIVATGFFDDALTRRQLAAVHKGIQDYSSALRYCNMMLAPGGGCETSLPSSYKHVVALRKNLCGALTLDNVGTVTDPSNPFEVMPVTKASFAGVDLQGEAARPLFVFFAVFILYLFYCSLSEELIDIIKVFDFLLYFPATEDKDDRGGLDRGDEFATERYKIERISTGHRLIIWPVWLTRIAILVAIIIYGSWYLLSEERYFEMVLNAVALSFITGIDEMIYASFIENVHQKQIGFEETELMEWQGFFVRHQWAQHFIRKDVLGVVICWVIAFVTVITYWQCVRLPNVEALSCACMQEGQHCAEAMVIQGGWWRNYWTQVLPGAIHHIDALHVRGA